MVRIKKKAVLFTIASIMLSSSLVILAHSYLDRNKDLQNTLTLSSIDKNQGYIADDIISNSYWDLLWLNLSSIERAGSDVTIKFNRAGILSPFINHQQQMDIYKNFIENSYSNLNKIDLKLNNFYSNFTILPFNSIFKINKTTFYFHTSDIASLNDITLTLTVNQTRDKEQTNTTPTNTGNKVITVNAYDPNGLNIFEGNPTTTNLDPLQTNDAPPYEVTFIGSDIKITFGSYNGNNGVLRIETNNMIVNITQFDISYTTNEKVSIKSDALLNITKLNNLNKLTDVVLYEE